MESLSEEGVDLLRDGHGGSNPERSSRRDDVTFGGGVSGVIDDNVPNVGREARWPVLLLWATL